MVSHRSDIKHIASHEVVERRFAIEEQIVIRRHQPPISKHRVGQQNL